MYTHTHIHQDAIIVVLCAECATSRDANTLPQTYIHTYINTYVHVYIHR